MITPDLIQRIQSDMQTMFCCNTTITRIEEYDTQSLYTGTCEEVGHTDDWSWIDRVFRVFFILHDYPAPGQSLPSDAILALPKQEIQDINSFIEGKPTPLAIYDIANSTTGTVSLLPQGTDEELQP